MEILGIFGNCQNLNKYDYETDRERSEMVHILARLADDTEAAMEWIGNTNDKVQTGKEEPSETLYNGYELKLIRDAYASAINFVKHVDSLACREADGVSLDFQSYSQLIGLE